MPLPEIYNSQPSEIASYNYTDIADGTGIRIFYFCKTSDSYVLVQNQPASTGIVVGGNGVTVYDTDFDLSPFNSPQMIRGTLMCSMNCLLGSSAHGQITIYVRKWNPATSTETEIVNKTGTALVHTGTGSAQSDLISLTVPPTIFAIGEQLRITVSLNVTAADWVYYGADPANTQWVSLAGATNSRVYVPFQLSTL